MKAFLLTVSMVSEVRGLAKPNWFNQLNVCTTSATEGEVAHVKLVKAPQQFITDHSKTVVLMWFSVACFNVKSFGDVSPYVCSLYFEFGLGC